MHTTRWLVTLASCLLTLFAITGCGTHHNATVTVTLGGPGHTTIPLTPIAQTIAAGQAKQAAAGHPAAAHALLRSEPAAASSPTALAHDRALKPAGQPTFPKHIPLAAVETPGCVTKLVRNYSSREGSPILLAVLHFTSSPDKGWAGVDANVSWFNNPAAQASSNYIIDRKIGACALVVPESQKAWAQAGFNRAALSVEVTANGSEGSYVVGKGKARLLQLMRRWHNVYKIPYRHGKVSGCTIVRTGFVMHDDLGQCGGGHVDVLPYEIDSLIREAAGGSVTSVDKVTCRKLNWWRTNGRPHGPAENNAIRRLKALTKRGVTCTAHGPTK